MHETLNLENRVRFPEGSLMKWIETEPGYWRADNKGLSYTIHDGSQRSDFPLGKFIVYRDSGDDRTSGYLDKTGKIAVGSAMFCAGGASKEMLFDTIEEAQAFAESDTTKKE